jgi:hypothetical protein
MTEFDDPFKDWDAAYVLGALSHEERREFENHLTHCDECTSAVSLFAGLPGFLGKIDSKTAVALLDGATTDPLHDSGDESLFLQKLAKRAEQERRKGKLRQTIGIVAAAIIAISVGVTTGVLVHSSNNVGTSGAIAISTAMRITNLQPQVMTASLRITSKAWGSRFDWNCSYSAAPRYGQSSTSYDLAVIDTFGKRSVIATWSSSGSKAVGLAATTALAQSQIKSVEITLAGTSNPLVVGVSA